MQARNRTGERPADGVFLRLLDVTAPAGANFDPQHHLKLTWNGQDADDLWRSPSPTGAGRSIGPNQQAEIGGTLQGLTPGEYTVKLGVGAADAPVDSEQQVNLKLFVKHRVWLPLAVLLAAILISYFATKGLEAQRKRVSQLTKVDEIRPGWLREEPPTLPVVAARAILRQVENRNRKWYDSLFGQDATGTLVATAELLLRILARMRRIRSRIKGSDWDKMIRNRANKRLDSIAGSLNPYTVDENAVKQIETELEGLEKWFDPKQRPDLYRSDLTTAMDSLAAQVKPETFGKHLDLVKTLRDEISTKRPENAKEDQLIQLEETYAKLKILCERNQDTDSKAALDELADQLNKNQDMSIEDFFRKADDIAWSKLKPSPIEFIAPDINYVDPLRAYQLLHFEVAPTDRILGENYLFKHNLKYIWSLVLETKSGKLYPIAHPITNEPRLVQFIPEPEPPHLWQRIGRSVYRNWPGKLYVSVTLRHGTDSSERADWEFRPIEKSSEFGWRSAFRFNELSALSIATLFAVISDLSTFYFGKPAFGVVGDYIALFLWGAGVDQTKNFIQNLERTSGGS